MALFNPQLGGAPSTFNPISDPARENTLKGINDVVNLAGSALEVNKQAKKAEAEETSARAYSNLFSETLKGEADALKGQQRLEDNQRMIDTLYADGVISEDEQEELNTLKDDRERLNDIQNPRMRQVRLRMQYANFVNRFPHLTKEARTMFGSADSRMEEIAQGEQGLVDQEAFSEIYGDNVTADNIAMFRRLQSYNGQRAMATQYGTANFDDWSTAFQANKTTEMYGIGKKIDNLVAQQGALRTEDMDAIRQSTNETYRQGIQQIDARVLEMRQQGMLVDDARVTAEKEELQVIRDSVLDNMDDKDFLTRIQNMNKTVEAVLTSNMQSSAGAVAVMSMGSGGGATGGATNLSTLQSLLANGSQIKAAKNLPNGYGKELAYMQDNLVEMINVMENFDAASVQQSFSPTMTRYLAEIQGSRVDNSSTENQPQEIGKFLDVLEMSANNDEISEAITSRPTAWNRAVEKDPETKGKTLSFVNNFASEVDTIMDRVGARPVKRNGQYVAMIGDGNGKMKPWEKGTDMLQRLQSVYNSLPAIGGMSEMDSRMEQYANRLSEGVEQMVSRFAGSDPTDQEVQEYVDRISTMYSLTEREIEQVKQRLRGDNGDTGA